MAIQQPIENYVKTVIWPFIRAHYVILSPLLLVSSAVLIPFLGVYMLLAAAWTVAFHASFLVLDLYS